MIRTMKNYLEKAIDFRQGPFWKKYMESIGWTVVSVDKTQLFIRKFPWGSSYIKIQHPLFTPSLKKIDALAKKYHAIAVVIEPHIYKFDETVFQKAGYTISALHHAPTATRKLDIQAPLAQIVASFSENAKRNIKKAQKNNLTIKTVLAKADKDNRYFEKYFALQKHLTEMKKFYAPGHEESAKKNRVLKNASFFVFAYDGSTLTTGKTNSDPVATVWYGFYEGVVTYLQTGITQRGYDLLANYLLVLEGINMGKKLGCRVLDFESIYDPRYPKEAVKWKGYSEFKSRFHGEEVYYPPSWIKIYNPFFRWFYNFSKPFIP
jgi:lipid II:glycine glycyltransferase (peptidoglycan interpeptide bridge formation enzyme)